MFLVFYFIILLFIFMPTHIVHPNTFIFGYYFLWLVCPAVVDFLLTEFGWEYVLPWGRAWDWSQLHLYTLMQIQVTMTTLVLLFYFFCGSNIGYIIADNIESERTYFARLSATPIINAVIWILIIIFIQESGGINAWIENYSTTYLTGRAGLGVINVSIIALGSFSMLLAGLRNFGRRGGWSGILVHLPLVLSMGFVGGFKSRLMILIFFFFLPYLLTLKMSVWRLVKYTFVFFLFLYILTLVRSEGFYSGGARFIELIPTYFNVFPLHDLIVQRENSSLFTTTHYPFVKLGQFLGLAGPESEYDISIMLTKEYFPDQWFLRSATQQWPLETELYLNYYGIIGQTIPLFLYALWVSYIFKTTFVKKRWIFYPIVAFEFFRIISTMRGVLIPWNFPIIIAQYMVFIGIGFFKLQPLKKVHYGKPVDLHS